MKNTPPLPDDSGHLDQTPLGRGEFHLWRAKDRADFKYMLLGAVAINQILATTNLPTELTTASVTSVGGVLAQLAIVVKVAFLR